MPQFVLLFHECPPGYERPSHWDFMLESGGMLRSWALSELPAAWHEACETIASWRLTCPPAASGDTVEAQALGDHRLAYLEFEGPLTGDRGRVARVDAGTFRTVSNSPETPQCLQIELYGELLRSAVKLMQSHSDDEQWTLSVVATA